MPSLIPAGVLPLAKPGGITSYDCIRRIKSIARPRRIGHAGTLDPMATGLLLILLNEATRTSSLLMRQPKTYTAEILFGIATDTDDVTGSIIARGPVPAVDTPILDAALQTFTGTTNQTPPTYSACKHHGRPLHRLARQGIAITPKPRPVTIYHITLLDWQPPRLRITLTVGAGTYVRSLARDLGQKLGTCATLAELQRTASGTISLQQALPLQSADPAAIAAALIPIPQALHFLPLLTITPAQARDITLGRSITIEQAPDGQLLLQTNSSGFLALAQAAAGAVKPCRIICPGQ